MSTSPELIGSVYRYYPVRGDTRLAIVRQVGDTSMVSVIEDDGRESQPVALGELEGKLEGPIGYAAEGGAFVAPAPTMQRWVLVPPVVYRYMNQQYINEFFSTGRLRLGSFATFKRHEDEERGDLLEGVNLVTGSSDVLTVAASLQQGCNSLILSTSMRADESLMRQFNCDGYFRIVDTHLFGQSIARSINGCTDGVEGFCTYKDAHLIRKKIFPTVVASMSAAKTLGALDLQAAAEVTAGLAGIEGFFSKRRQFEHQSEYRLIWNLNREINDCEFVYCPEAIQHCERVT
jgi:hypothetical protein